MVCTYFCYSSSAWCPTVCCPVLAMLVPCLANFLLPFNFAGVHSCTSARRNVPSWSRRIPASVWVLWPGSSPLPGSWWLPNRRNRMMRWQGGTKRGTYMHLRCFQFSLCECTCHLIAWSRRISPPPPPHTHTPYSISAFSPFSLCNWRARYFLSHLLSHNTHTPTHIHPNFPLTYTPHSHTHTHPLHGNRYEQQKQAYEAGYSAAFLHRDLPPGVQQQPGMMGHMMTVSPRHRRRKKDPDMPKRNMSVEYHKAALDLIITSDEQGHGSWHHLLCNGNIEAAAVVWYTILRGVSNRWTGIWTGTVEWTMEFLFVADGTVSHCVPASFVPFHLVRPQKSLLYCSKGY